MNYRLGKTPARPGSVKLKLTDYLVGLPEPPSYGGHRTLVKNWEGVLGNDQYGDCVWAGADHETILWQTEGKTVPYFTTENALSDYSACTGFNPNDPNTDNGTDMQVAASYRQKTGVIDSTGNRHKVAAYLAIGPGNVDELKKAVHYFSAVGIGIRFPAFAMDQFRANKPWSISKTNDQIEGGHYVAVVGYTKQWIYVVTWGKIQKMTWAFFKKYCDEAIVYLSDEMMSGGVSLEGFNLQQLQSDLNQLTR